jgi:hypothetical protein
MELRTPVERARSPRFYFCYIAKGMALLSNFRSICVASVIRENQITDVLTRASLINEMNHLSALLPRALRYARLRASKDERSVAVALRDGRSATSSG